jgi:hypothetical protein
VNKFDLAAKLANSLTKIEDVDCPRNIINPGLYFGFIKGYEVLEDQVRGLEQQIENLRMACRRISAAKTLESRDRIAAQCYGLFSGSPIRDEKIGTADD